MISCSTVFAQEISESDKVAMLNNSDRDARMEWFREARFGMFIHWGLYAIPAGEWKGERAGAEWILQTNQIPVNEYEELVPQFNPVDFDAEAWVLLAKEAGMKYITITTKHHDGFCLFDSEFTDYDILATPFKRDIMDEMAKACRKHDIRICWYYSIMDWHHQDYLPRRKWEDRSAEGADLERYYSYMRSQLKEILTNYGDISVLWFDGGWEDSWTQVLGHELYEYVLSISPTTLTNNRIGKEAWMSDLALRDGYAGDFDTPEQQIPSRIGKKGWDWETCMTLNDHWGYCKRDKNWKWSSDIILKLVDIVSKGGNFLLNVGPDEKGNIPEASVDRLKSAGKWLKVYGESIYGSQASKYGQPNWGRFTYKQDKNGDEKLFIHLVEWPEGSEVIIPEIEKTAKACYLLSNGKKVNYEAVEDNGIRIDLKGIDQEFPDTVIVLEF